jgi:predicted 2-oxoglutarate/Fe(II)-dependent dioxygenase YbiX
VKYEDDKQCHLEMHDDDSTITSAILLSDNNDFSGGGILFEDELQYNLNIGDMIIHCGKSKHSGVKITNGKRYVLVLFIKIFVN